MALYELESSISIAVAGAQRCGPHYGPRLLSFLSEAQALVSNASSTIAEATSDKSAPPNSLAHSLQSSVLSIFLQSLSLAQIVIERLRVVLGEQQLGSVSPGPSKRQGGSTPSISSSSGAAAAHRSYPQHAFRGGGGFQGSVSPTPRQTHNNNRASDVDSVVSSSAAESTAASRYLRRDASSWHPGNTTGEELGEGTASVLLGLQPQALVDFVCSAVQLMERVSDCASRLVKERNAKLRRSMSCNSANSIIDPSLEILRAVLQCEENARFWSRHFGLKVFTASTIEFCDKLILETSHISESAARGQVISDLVLNVLDLNADGSVDLVEFSLVLPAKSIVTAVEHHVQLRVSSQQMLNAAGSGGGNNRENCERCQLVEAELAIRSREVSQLQDKLREARIQAKASGAAAVIQRLEIEVEDLRNENAQLREQLMQSSSQHHMTATRGPTNFEERSRDAVARSKAMLESDRLRRVVVQMQQQQEASNSGLFGAGHYPSSSVYSASDVEDGFHHRHLSARSPVPSSVMVRNQAGPIRSILETDMVASSSWYQGGGGGEEEEAEDMVGNMDYVSAWSASPSVPSVRVTRQQREITRGLDDYVVNTVKHALGGPESGQGQVAGAEMTGGSFSSPLPDLKPLRSPGDLTGSGSEAGGVPQGNSNKKSSKHASSSSRGGKSSKSSLTNAALDTAAADFVVVSPLTPAPSKMTSTPTPSDAGREAASTPRNAEEQRSTTPPPGPRVRKVENFL